MSKEIEINSFDDLVGFIKKYKLPFGEYLKVIRVFTGKEVLWIDKKTQTQDNLLNVIESFRDQYDKLGYFPPLLDLFDIRNRNKI